VKRAPWPFAVVLLAVFLVLLLGRWFTRPGQIFATVDRAVQTTADGTVLRIGVQLQYADSELPFWQSASLPVGRKVGPIVAKANRIVLARITAEGANSQRVTVPLKIRGSSRWNLDITRGPRPIPPAVSKGWATGVVPLPLENRARMPDTLWIVWWGGVVSPTIS
jgi:hypothetical protein